MIAGSYFALTGRVTLVIVLLSLPVSALISNILLANELRDFERDSRLGFRTLTMRIGYRAALGLFAGLLALAYGSSLLFMLTGRYPAIPALFAALPLTAPSLYAAFRRKGLISGGAAESSDPMAPVNSDGTGPDIGQSKAAFIPWMMMHHLVFGILYCIPIIKQLGENLR